MNWADGSLPFYCRRTLCVLICLRQGIRDALICFAGKIIQQLQRLRLWRRLKQAMPAHDVRKSDYVRQKAQYCAFSLWTMGSGEFLKSFNLASTKASNSACQLG